MDYTAIIPFIGYFLIVIFIGIYASKYSSKGISEYFIGGRNMGRFVVALSSVVSARSAWLLLGVTGLAYMIGFAAIWTVIGYIVVEFLLFLFYAPRLREYSEKYNCITIPDFFAEKFNDKSGQLRIMIVVIFILFMITYVAAQFVAGGKAFTGYFHISHNLGLIITASIIFIYTILGGFLAVSLTDVFQAIVMLIILVALPVIGVINLGGWDSMMEVLEKLPNIKVIANSTTKEFITNNETIGTLLNPFSLSIAGIVGGLGIGLGSPGNPHILVRYMSIKDKKQFTWTAIVGTIWNILLAAGAIFIGLVGRAHIPEITSGELSSLAAPNGDPENIYIALASKVFHPVLIGLLLASIFAAIMSTADSQLLIAASSIVRDIYEKIIKRKSTLQQQKLTFMSRIVVAIIVILSVVLGIFVEDLVFWFVLFAWAGLGAAIGPTSILTLFWKKTTKQGVIAGLFGGTVTVILWNRIACLKTIIYELVPGFFVALILTVLVSMLTFKEET